MLLAAVLASALLHAAWNALLRGHPDRRAGGVAVIAIASALATLVALAVAAHTRTSPFPDGAGLAASALAGVFEAGYLISLQRGLAVGELAPVYTISRGGSLVLVWPISILALGEAVSAFSIAGTCVVVAGLAIAGLERAVPRRALAWAVSTAAFIAGYHVVYKVALGAGASPPAVFAVAITLALPAQALAMRAGPRAVLAAARSSLRLTVSAGVLCTASFLVFLVALRDAGAGAVLTLRNTSVVFAVGFGALLGDRPSRRQVVGAVLVAAGAALVGAG